MANPYSDWQAFPLANSPGDPDPDQPYLKAAQAIQTAQAKLPDPDPDLPYLQGAAAIARITPGPSYDTNLGMTRTRFATEMQQNPDLRRKLMASMTAEVGDQGAQAQQAYLETVMNRAAARNMSLNAVISDPHYYPKTTTSKLGATFSQPQQDNLNPLINSALSGSNLANFATGNDSGKVHSGGAPIAFDPSPGSKTGDRFVIETPDQRWAMGFARIAQQAPTPTPTPTRPLTWQELMATSPMVAGP